MRTLAVVFASLLLAGCSSQPSGPTYAEAVATYQAEVALLDSLLEKRKAIEKQYDTEMADLLARSAFSDEYTRAILDARGKVIGMNLEQVGEMLFREEGDGVNAETEKWVAAKRVKALRQLQEIEPQISRQHELVKKAEDVRNAMSAR